MEETRMIVRKKVEGEIQYNDGEFAEIQTNGIEGIEKDLLLATIQIHRGDSSFTCEEFQQRFPVGIWLDIVTITDITVRTEDSELQDERNDDGGKWQGSIQ